jgi:hypothetical protein
MVPSCGARSAGRPTSRDEPPGELWQVRRWGVTSQELAAVHYEKWGPRQQGNGCVVGVSAASCKCECCSCPPRAILTGGRCWFVRRFKAWVATACLCKRGEILHGRGYPLRKPHCGYGNDNVALIRLVLT